MTWLEIMDMLDKMPRHLLKHEAQLWHYDDKCNYEVLPIDDIVTPITDGGSDEDWGPDGDYRLSLQSFDEERKPRLNEYAVAIHRICNVSVMAEDPEQAQRIGEKLAGGYTSFACDNINETMSRCDDFFYGVGSTGNGPCHLYLDAEDSMRVLNEEE